MSLKDELSVKIAADREAGRDIPVVIEELFLKIVDFLEPAETPSEEAMGADPAPADVQQQEIKDPVAGDPANQAPEALATQQ